MANRDADLSTSDKLVVNDIVRPANLPLPVWAEYIKGKVVGETNIKTVYHVEFNGVVVPIQREDLRLVRPWLVVGDRVRIVPDSEDQVESLLRLSTTDEMEEEIGTVLKVANGWGCNEWGGNDKASAETRTTDSFWYYTVQWPSGHKDNFLHDGDLCRIDE
jgi:hypothetical protein